MIFLGCGDRKPIKSDRSRSVDHQFGIRQIGKPGALRTLEVFAALRFPVEAEQGSFMRPLASRANWPRRSQEAADGAGAGDIVGHIVAIISSKISRIASSETPADAHRLQEKGIAAAVGRAAHQAEAAIGRVPRKQRDVGFGQAGDRVRVLPDDFDAQPFAGRDSAGKEKKRPPQ